MTSINAGSCFFGVLFLKLEKLFNDICELTNIFNSVTELYFAPKNKDERDQREKQKEFDNKKKAALDKFSSKVQSETDLDFLLGIAPVHKYVADKTGLTKLNIDDLFIAYYKLLLK